MPQAAIWQGGVLQFLGTLPGLLRSEVVDLSADGSVAIGNSGSFQWGESRAFRWEGGALEDLGSASASASSITADGTVIVGSETGGAMLWDAEHGVRRLTDVLSSEHGVDLGGWQLDHAWLVSADGSTFLGTGRDPEGGVRTWRVRLAEPPCSEPPPIDLVAHQRAGERVDRPNGIAVDSQKRVYVAGFESRNVLRLDASFASFPAPDAEEVLDLTDDGDPDDAGDRPIVLGVGPDDAVYVSAFGRRQLIRIAADGTREIVFDGSGYPYLSTPAEEPGFPGVPTAPLGVAFGADGTRFVNACARILRIDPDGSVHELFDVMTAAQIILPGATDYMGAFLGVTLLPGELLVSDEGGRVFALDLVTGAAALRDYGMSSIRRVVADGQGGAWIGGSGLAHLAADRTVETLFSEWDDPEITGLEYGRMVTGIAPSGANVIYTDGIRVLERAPDGSWNLLLHSGTPSVFGSPVGSIGSLQISHGATAAPIASLDPTSNRPSAPFLISARLRLAARGG